MDAISTGGIVGAVVGAVIGFVVGGPYGAMYGAAIGLGIGMWLDPFKPDMPAPGKPDVGELTITLAKEGLIIPDVNGLSQLNGNIIFSCCPRVVEIKETQEVSGGKGGGGSQTQETTTGYEYYHTWGILLCMGPVDGLFSIWQNDKSWYGQDTDLIPRGLERGSDDVTNITLFDGKGTADFYWGTNAAPIPTYSNLVSSAVTDAGVNFNIPYRNQCWCLMKDVYIGDYRRVPSLAFVVGKSPQATEFPVLANLTDSYREIEIYDYNPAWAVAYMLCVMVGLPESYVNWDSFDSVAAELYNEVNGGWSKATPPVALVGRGVSITYGQAQSVRAYLTSLFAHIGGVLRYRADGKFHLKLFRGDEDVDDLPLISDFQCLKSPKIRRKAW